MACYTHDMKQYLNRIKSGLLSSVRHAFVLEGKPYAATSREWREWEASAKRSQPLAYWLNEVAKDWLEARWRNVLAPFEWVRSFFRYRIFDRYHLIKTGLEPGYADADTRMLHGMFNLLVDFVEVEKAWMNVVFDEDERKRRKHPWWSLGWTRFKAFRDPEAGIAHLRWETTLDDPAKPAHERSPSQAATAREILVLYYWWKDIRPKRPDPMDASGWSDYCDQRRKAKESNGDAPSAWDLLDFEDETPDDQARSSDILDECHRIEALYEKEDEEMLIRLVKIRKSLWT